MKRKADSRVVNHKPPKKHRSKTAGLSEDEAKERFRPGLFDPDVLASYTSQYASSSPYRHAVIESLVSDDLLRQVRSEIRASVSFTPKETDIYKIHQSGDLANLDGLPTSSLARLPSLLKLRDALYSETFRAYVSSVTGSGPLSGRKTDMAVNIYTPGCFLLCHDDVIGSRRVSYILYLTDPDKPWKAEWGGALRLFSVIEKGEATTPGPDPVKVIPPAWNQLSFFAVQPGKSFHDVEEVYRRPGDNKQGMEEDGGRVRMAISGWFHIPQVGETGYVKGEEEKLARNSGRMQLKGEPDQYDLPQAQLIKIKSTQASAAGFDEADLDFLLRYLSPTYLTPDTLEQIAENFEESSSITLPDILNPKFAAKLKSYVVAQEGEKLPDEASEIETKTSWKVARPPHKHRFLYQQPSKPDQLRTFREESPITDLIDVFLPSRQFRQWLQIATSCLIQSRDILARRFRRGKDYTLATGHDGSAKLEINLGITPTTGWGDIDDEEEEKEKAVKVVKGSKMESAKVLGTVRARKGKGREKRNDREKIEGKGIVDQGEPKTDSESEDEDAMAIDKVDKVDSVENLDNVGGHEVYMAGDDDAHGDAAIYKPGGSGGGDDDEDDDILFFQAAAWNKMTMVLRDSGTMRFVKYVSRSAKGDRWDILGSFDVEDQTEEEEGDGADGTFSGVESEEEFEGFSDDDDDAGQDDDENENGGDSD